MFKQLNIGFLIMILFENVTYRYSENLPPALLNVTLEFKTGESVCIMGANGSGKSTFAKLVAGLIKSQQGRFSIQAKNSSPIPVALLFQNPDNQLVAVTVEKEVAFALENQGVDQAQMKNRITNVLEKLSISHLRNRLTSELSVGEKQRVALASVLVSEPAVLILDEPDSYLDKEGKSVFRSLLKKLKANEPSLTIIEITQYPKIAYEHDRLIVFYQGKVAVDNRPQAILKDNEICAKLGIGFADVKNRQIVAPESWTDLSNDSVERVCGIKLERVSFSYFGQDKPVIKNFSSVLNYNEITVVVGPSGSGKSTLGMLICGILEPDTGGISYLDNSGGEILNHISGRRVTSALQQPERQFFLQSALEEIEFGPKNFGKKITAKTVRELFGLSGLPYERFSTRDPFTLSLGEKRRLAFASVLSITPNFIVFDEPTCALDQEGVGRFVALARALQKSGFGIVIISHDDNIIESLADKIIEFDGQRNFWNISKEQYLAGQTAETTQISQ